MRLPRWLVVSLLSASVLAVLGYVSWWWVTWPERTAWELMHRWDAGQFIETNPILTDARWEKSNDSPNVCIQTNRGAFSFRPTIWEACTRTTSRVGIALTDANDEKNEQFAMVLQSRSLTDVLAGRQVLRLKLPLRTETGRLGLDFTIERRIVRGEMREYAE
jgi:hypothetical protein